jgi:diguanylate cyclase (GGDEF)-like protein/PAS domain S-box-containing protein
MFSKNPAIQNRLFEFIENSLDACAIFDANDSLQYCNMAFADIFCAVREDILGQTFTDLAKGSYEKEQGLHIEAEDLDGWLQYMQSVRRKKEFRLFEVDLTDGRWFLFSEQLNEADELFVHARNITEQKRIADRIQNSNERFRHLSLTDEITGIPSRRHFISSSKAELSRCWRSGKQAALMLVEFDCISKIKEDFGSPAGDSALRHTAELIRETLREYDIFGRIGPDQFAVFLGQSDAAPAPNIAERIRALVESHPLNFADNSLPLTVSIGLSLQPFDTPFEQLYEQADKALYAAKVKGRNRVEIYVRE